MPPSRSREAGSFLLTFGDHGIGQYEAASCDSYRIPSAFTILGKGNHFGDALSRIPLAEGHARKLVIDFISSFPMAFLLAVLDVWECRSSVWLRHLAPPSFDLRAFSADPCAG